MGFLISENIVNFEAFWWDKKLSNNLLFLGSAVCMYLGGHFEEGAHIYLLAATLRRDKVVQDTLYLFTGQLR